MYYFFVFGFMVLLLIIVRLAIFHSLDKNCPDCGFFFACDECSERMCKIDEDLDKKLK